MNGTESAPKSLTKRTMRGIRLPGVEKAILSDTVGFISDLPTQLVAAFRAALEEVTAADIILHVRDMANPANAMQKQQVLEVLRDLGVMDGEDDQSTIPIMEAWNKLDLLDKDQREELLALAEHDEIILPISAMQGDGVQLLAEQLGARLTEDAEEYEITLPASDGQLDIHVSFHCYLTR